jgi:hypothetical protein
VKKEATSSLLVTAVGKAGSNRDEGKEVPSEERKTYSIRQATRVSSQPISQSRAASDVLVLLVKRTTCYCLLLRNIATRHRSKIGNGIRKKK